MDQAETYAICSTLLSIDIEQKTNPNE